MSTTNEQHTRREAIRSTLADRVGGAPDAAVVAAAIVGTWHELADQLRPVIGARGVDALFSRALHLTRASFPWLTTADDDPSSAALLERLAARLAGREQQAAAAAGQALLVTFAELLAGLIGTSLTDRLLSPVWAPRSTASKQGTTR